jgi:hypothetical protein
VIILKIVFGKYFVSLKHFETEYEFSEYLNTCDLKLVLNYNDDYSDTYDIITVYSEEKFDIGIQYDWHGLQPNLLLFPNHQKIMCSFENEIVCVDCMSKNIVFRHTLNSLIFSINYVEARHIIVVIQEMEIMVMHETGQEIWSCGGTDIIQNYEISDDWIYILCADGYDITFSILDGEPI